MKKKIKTLLSLLLAAAMIAGLASCKKGGGEEDFGNQLDGLEKVRLEHVYTMSYIDMGEGEDADDSGSESTAPVYGENEYSYHDEYVDSVTEAGGKVYIVKRYYNEEYSDGEYVSDNGLRVSSLDPDSGEVSDVADFKQENDSSENAYHYKGVNNVAPCSDGSFWCVVMEEFGDWSDPTEYNYTTLTSLVHTAADGSELASIDLADVIENMPEYFYIDRMIVSPGGDLIIYTDPDMYVIGPDGALKHMISAPSGGNMWVSSVCSTGSGDVVCLVIDYENNKRTLYRVNVETGSLDMLADIEITDAYNCVGGAGTTVLFNIGSALYSYDYSAKTQQELINWLNSDINPNRLDYVTPLSDGRFIAMERSRDYSKTRLALLSKASEDDAVEKYVINYAAVYLDNNLQDAIIEFNKQNSDFRIQFIDYSKYNSTDDYSAGIHQLNMDIISGKVPDILSLDELPFQTYASKGILLDMGAALASDPSFNRADYLENILDAPQYNGKSYSVIPSFSVYTIIGKSDYVGEEPGWTVDDLHALMEAHPESALFETMTKSNLLTILMYMSIDDYINYDNGTCSFDSPAFIKLLEIANSFPDSIDWESYYGSMTDADWEARNNAYRDGSILLEMNAVSRYDDIKDQMNNFGGAMTYKGFPASSGSGSVIMPNMELAISSKSRLKGACLDFIKYLMSNEYLSETSYGFPINRSVLEQQAAEAMDASRFGDVGAYDSAYGSDDYYWNKPLTQEQVDQVNALISSVTSVFRYSEDVLAIIEEESGAYFAGQKSAQDVASIIQSRVQIYVSENR
ncbi:MAG: extracellular solute-binding protein [Oscillospiraceae bacterium]|nr:extracellular solute-binding protein [Oscillospiraceae bacterium]